MGKFFCYLFSPQIAYLQILKLIPQSQIRKFLKSASPQLAYPQICNDQSGSRKYANLLGVLLRNRKSTKEKAVFLNQIRIVLNTFLPFNLPKHILDNEMPCNAMRVAELICGHPTSVSRSYKLCVSSASTLTIC